MHANEYSEASDGGYPTDIVFIVKQDGTILYLNRSVPGVPESQILGTSVFTYTSPDQHEAVRASLAKVFSTGDPDGYECAGTAPFAEGAWYQCRVAANKREGKVVSATIIARDITRWKKAAGQLRHERDRLQEEMSRAAVELDRLKSSIAEQEQRERELDRFRKLVDQAGEAIFITDPDTGRFVDVNDTACRWLGRPRDKLLTMTVRDLDVEFPLESPNGVPEHVTDTRGLQRPKVYSEGLHRRRNGTAFPVEVAIARRQFGDREYVLVVARDIKQRRLAEQAVRESEDKYRSLFELSHDAIYLSARDGSVVEVNDAAIDLFGYTRAEFRMLEARRLYARGEDIRKFQKAVDESGSVRDMEIEFLNKAGEQFTGLLTATLRHDGDGSVLGYQCIIRLVSANGTQPDAEGAAAERAGQPAKNAVLVVDSDKTLLSEVRGVLERAGISVLTARTSAAGVQVFHSQPDEIGTILLGIDDAEVDAASAVERLRAVDPQVHIVLLINEIGRVGLQQLAERLAVDIIPKPIHPLALIQRVRDALAAHGSA